MGWLYSVILRALAGRPPAITHYAFVRLLPNSLKSELLPRERIRWRKSALFVASHPAGLANMNCPITLLLHRVKVCELLSATLVLRVASIPVMSIVN